MKIKLLGAWFCLFSFYLIVTTYMKTISKDSGGVIVVCLENGNGKIDEK